jgi:hypothetical protein
MIGHNEGYSTHLATLSLAAPTAWRGASYALLTTVILFLLHCCCSVDKFHVVRTAATDSNFTLGTPLPAVYHPTLLQTNLDSVARRQNDAMLGKVVGGPQAGLLYALKQFGELPSALHCECGCVGVWVWVWVKLP